MAELPFIPETITVHLGAPGSSVENRTVPFPEYIKNVASSEIYPTWPENAIRANIYAQISFALNRIYTEYYRSRGYPYDITNSTAFDQSFVAGRDIFENISRITDEIFTDYIVRQGSIEPLFAQYCSGTTVTCNGLSQWGTVSLAEQGYGPYEILQYYYGDNIDLRTASVRGFTPSVPEQPLRLGTNSNDVLTVQTRLNRISANYPSIPKIQSPNGFFQADTEDAVVEFQRIFDLTADGIVGPATWYRIQYIYNGVKRLNELDSEGLTYADISKQFPEVLRQGDSGVYVRSVQYLLNYVAQYENTIEPFVIDGYFGEATTAAVEGFQRTYGLPIDGVIGEETYEKLYDVYTGLVASLPSDLFVNRARPFSGTGLVLGSTGEDVTLLQEYLNTIGTVYTSIPPVEVTGIYGSETQEAVRAAQTVFGLPPSGITFAATWNAIAGAYDDIRAGYDLQEGQYPGYVLSEEGEGV